MLLVQSYSTLAYCQFNRVILRCICLTQYTVLSHFSCWFLICNLFWLFCAIWPSYFCVSTVIIFTASLLAAAAWAYVYFRELNISISFLASVYKIPLPLFFKFYFLLFTSGMPYQLMHDFSWQLTHFTSVLHS